ncbi:MAG: dihydrodipicolinate synthase family protein [Candidatus Marinimicrobia bacterium]|nr:dihydrodipicolinate synthase family protein [Candidatus Neomarinimicrobiota bacterium]
MPVTNSPGEYSHSLAGAYAPLLTPFGAGRLGLALGDIRRQLDFITEAGMDGALLLGTNGEFSRLDHNEKLELVRAVFAHDCGAKFLVGATVPDSPGKTLELAAELAGMGDKLAGLLVAPPYYARTAAGESIQLEELAGFYRQLAAVTYPALLILYNLPRGPSGPATAAITAELLGQLAEERQIAAVKDSSGRLENIPAFTGARPGLQVLVGTDHILAPALAAGAVGSVTACGNVFPAAVTAVYQASPGPGRIAAQQELSRLRAVLELVPGKLIATQKLLLHLLRVMPRHSPVRDRSAELTQGERKQVVLELEAVARSLQINQAIGRQVSEIAG